MREHRYYVYIVASRSHTLYIGITSAIEKRVQQHRDGTFQGFSSQYKCNRLVHLETYSDVHRAIAREKQLKRWSRSKKTTLIKRENPTWHDLSQEWGRPLPAWREPCSVAGSTQVSPRRCAPVEMTNIPTAASNLSRSTNLSSQPE